MKRAVCAALFFVHYSRIACVFRCLLLCLSRHLLLCLSHHLLLCLSRHLLLHKPAGVLTAKEDNRQKTVMDLLPPEYTSLGCMPVGRLDKDTTGLLILTTDGELAHRLIAPERHVDKVYIATVDG